jgi:hypothetical protein
MKKSLFEINILSVFLICSMSIIPSAQSSMIKEEIENKVIEIINLIDNLRNLIVLWLISALPITLIWIIIFTG